MSEEIDLLKLDLYEILEDKFEKPIRKKITGLIRQIIQQAKIDQSLNEKVTLLSARRHGKEFIQFLRIRHLISTGDSLIGYGQVGESMVCMSMTKFKELTKN